MKFPDFVAITGKAGAGKDTIGSILCDTYGYSRYAFADAIRDMVKALFINQGLDIRYMTERELKELPIPGLGVSYRQMMQKLGTEWGRALDPDIWVNLLYAKLQRDASDSFSPLKVVITDLRFQNEAQFVRRIGGEIWRVEREQLYEVVSHISETEMVGIKEDAVFHNNGNISDLRKMIEDHGFN